LVVRIDPVLEYSTYLGVSGSDRPADIAVDGQGSAYVVGQTSSADLPVAGGVSPALRGTHDAFVAKFDARARPWSI
jgi:hypothetical protein